MKVIYVAGPYRAATVHGILENIRNAERVAIQVWRSGYYALCPHLNSAFFDGAVSDKTFIKGTLEMLNRCEGMVLCPGWETSRGTLDEMAHCYFNAIPVYLSPRYLASESPISLEELDRSITLARGRLSQGRKQ